MDEEGMNELIDSPWYIEWEEAAPTLDPDDDEPPFAYQLIAAEYEEWTT